MRALSIALLVLSAGAVQAGDGDIEAARAFVAALRLGETLQHGDVTVVPLQIVGEPADPGISAQARDGGLSFAEPEFPTQRHDLLVRNDTDRTILLSGGTVIVGGRLDRLVRRDHLIAPGSECEIRTIPAASSSDFRKDPAPFEVSPVLAPLYVRGEADFGGSQSVVTSFIARWLDFRNEGDRRKSLAALVDSKALREYVLGTKAELNQLPAALARPQVAGGVSALHGRVQSLTAYGTNDLLAACFPPAVKGATYASAAIAIRARQAGVPTPGLGDPGKRAEIVRAAAEKLLGHLQKATYKEEKLAEGEAGSSLQVRLADGTRGRVTLIDGRVVHLVLFPRDPFSAKLYGSAIDVPDERAEPTAEPEPAGGADEGGELSQDEVRFLERGRHIRPRGGRK